MSSRQVFNWNVGTFSNPWTIGPGIRNYLGLRIPVTIDDILECCQTNTALSRDIKLVVEAIMSLLTQLSKSLDNESLQQDLRLLISSVERTQKGRL